MTRPVPKPPPKAPPLRAVPRPPGVAVAAAFEEQLGIGYWNHQCPAPGCGTWVPNHLRGCARHGSA